VYNEEKGCQRVSVKNDTTLTTSATSATENFYREPLPNKYGGNDYAAMTFSDAPNGRRIQLSWMNTWGDASVFQRMPFNHQFTVPRELTLRTTPQGKVRLYTEPVEELKTLRGVMSQYSNVTVESGERFMIPYKNELFDMEAVISLGSAKGLVLNMVGRKVEYNVAEKWIALDDIRAPVGLADGVLRLRVIVDRTSIELFAQDGEVQIAKVFRPQEDADFITVSQEANGGNVVIDSVKIWEMKSVWKR